MRPRSSGPSGRARTGRKDLIVVPDLQASNLDPTSNVPGVGTRGGIDCTKPSPPSVYEQRSFIPAEVMESIDLSRYLRQRSTAAV